MESRPNPDGDGWILSEELGELRARDLMDEILDRKNFEEAVRQVVRNRGAEGMDGMSVLELPDYVEQHWDGLYVELRTGRYIPKPVRRVVIPKPDGGVRNLGVPTVLDRAVQQAVAQVLSGIYEPKFSERSFGFRPGKSAHDAIATVRNDCEDGYIWVVDIDLSKYFDTINHSILMDILRRDIRDETVLILIKRFLQSGVMVEGVVQPTEEGSPQGGNLSPLLANIYLNEYDRVLKERGHRFVRYADDLMILMRSEKGAQRVMESSRKYLEGTLKLRVNQAKSRVAPVAGLKYLGFTIDQRSKDGTITHRIALHPKSAGRLKVKIRDVLRKKGKSVPVEDRLKYLTAYLNGWLGYYGLAEMVCLMEHIGKYIRRKVRALLLKQWKRTYRRGRNLQTILAEHGLEGVRISFRNMWKSIKYDGIWRMANNPFITKILHNRYLESIGCPNMLNMYKERHQILLNRRDTRVRPVV